VTGSLSPEPPIPCPCGYFNDPRHECICSPAQIARYLAKISGPLLDRIDLQVEVPALSAEEIASTHAGEPSAAIRERVDAARLLQRERFRRSQTQCNAEMTPRAMRKFCELDAPSRRLLEQAMSRLALSARAYDRVLRLRGRLPTSAGAKGSNRRTSLRRFTTGRWTRRISRGLA